MSDAFLADSVDTTLASL